MMTGRCCSKPSAEDILKFVRSMKKILQIKKNEPLHEWLDRIADYRNFNEELREVLEVVSKESYIQGSNAAVESLKKKGK